MNDIFQTITSFVYLLVSVGVLGIVFFALLAVVQGFSLITQAIEDSQGGIESDAVETEPDTRVIH